MTATDGLLHPSAKTLSEPAQRKIAALVASLPVARTALLPALKLAQDDRGYLSPALTAEVADLVGVSHAAAYELVAFYSMLRSEPQGRTRIVVCAQLPCALNGANRVLRDLSAGLNVAAGSTTSDGRFTLERTSECFGSCHRAPMARVNDIDRENLTPDATRALILELTGANPATRD